DRRFDVVARAEAEIAVALAGHDHAHHRAGHHQFQLHRAAIGGDALQGHLDQRAAGVDLAAQHVRAGGTVLPVGLDRIAQRLERLRKEEHRIAVAVVHSRDPFLLAQTRSMVSAAAASRAIRRASSTSAPRARVTPTRRWPATRGLPNRRMATLGWRNAAPISLNTGTP